MALDPGMAARMYAAQHQAQRQVTTPAPSPNPVAPLPALPAQQPAPSAWGAGAGRLFQWSPEQRASWWAFNHPNASPGQQAMANVAGQQGTVQAQTPPVQGILPPTATNPAFSETGGKPAQGANSGITLKGSATDIQQLFQVMARMAQQQQNMPVPEGNMGQAPAAPQAPGFDPQFLQWLLNQGRTQDAQAYMAKYSTPAAPVIVGQWA